MMVLVVILTSIFRTIASPIFSDTTPLEITVSNLSAGSFTISYVTLGEASGEILLNNATTIKDVRDGSSPRPGLYLTHYFIANGLVAGSEYPYTIFSGEKSLKGKVVLPASDSSGSGDRYPISGILESRVGGVIIYSRGQDGKTYSSLTKKNGGYLFFADRPISERDLMAVDGPGSYKNLVKNPGFKRSFAIFWPWTKRPLLMPIAQTAVVAASPFGDENSLNLRVAGTSSGSLVVVTTTPAPTPITVLFVSPSPTPRTVSGSGQTRPVTGSTEVLLGVLGLGFGLLLLAYNIFRLTGNKSVFSR
jgi:hypothetical protein